MHAKLVAYSQTVNDWHNERPCLNLSGTHSGVHSSFSTFPVVSPHAPRDRTGMGCGHGRRGHQEPKPLQGLPSTVVGTQQRPVPLFPQRSNPGLEDEIPLGFFWNTSRTG